MNIHLDVYYSDITSARSSLTHVFEDMRALVRHNTLYLEQKRQKLQDTMLQKEEENQRVSVYVIICVLCNVIKLTQIFVTFCNLNCDNNYIKHFLYFMNWYFMHHPLLQLQQLLSDVRSEQADQKASHLTQVAELQASLDHVQHALSQIKEEKHQLQFERQQQLQTLRYTRAVTFENTHQLCAIYYICRDVQL